MSYVIYNLKTKQRLKSALRHESWGQKRTAKSVLTKAVNRGEVVREEWTVAEYDEWVAADHEIEVTSAFDGKTKIKIRASDKGGCTDPSMDVYWQS